MDASTEALAELKRLPGTGVAILIGTGDEARVPELSRAWGLRVSDNGEAIDVSVHVGVAGLTLDNLAADPRVAVTMSSPSTYRSLQVKGRAVATRAAGKKDRQRVAGHQAAFTEEVQSIGVPLDAVTSFLEYEKKIRADLVTISVQVEAVFDQTPGPSAGARV
jgi:hypothetical protein